MMTLDLSATGLLHGRLQMSLSSSWSRDEDLAYGVDTDTHALGGGMLMVVSRSSGWPVTLGLNGDWQRLRDRLLNTVNESWQVYATLRLQWK